ncbi:hypothetical protein F4808DRAFT_461621 [Astrocystis sublimbata]|nr:hypothetical protein F4808DRAFT_461621 [Astrocystis sublimbata]
MQLTSALVAFLGATSIALPTANFNTPRQLGALTQPLTTIFTQVGKHVPPAIAKLSGTPAKPAKPPKTPTAPTNGTAAATAKPAAKPPAKKPDSGLGALSGIIGGIAKE